MSELSPLEVAFVAAVEHGDGAEANRIEALIDAEQDAHDARLAGSDALATAALWYAANDIAVFPCRPGAKAPLTRHGFKDATTDPDSVRAWWAATPDANIGLPTGVRFDVFDIDGPEGTIAFGQHKDAGALPPILAWARTPHGFHYLVPPAGHGNAVRLLPSVDYRGTGGYVLAPPSRVTCDRTRGCFNRGTHVYRWTRAQPLTLTALPALSEAA